MRVSRREKQNRGIAFSSQTNTVYCCRLEKRPPETPRAEVRYHDGDGPLKLSVMKKTQKRPDQDERRENIQVMLRGNRLRKNVNTLGSRRRPRGKVW
jgi:hypothetical protein